jgi:hypothetical protein
MPYWSPLIDDGVIYDLSHLEPFEFPIIPIGMTDAITLSVRFHDHCFTEEFDPARHVAVCVTNQSSKHEKRAFAPDRYSLSFHLPRIIRNLSGQKIASTREGNLVKITLADGRSYPMFFTLRYSSGRRVEMFVVSAYEWTKANKPATTGQMKFSLVVGKIARREKPKFPPR